eukprot:comp22168_c0_seq1/m.32522 comp22168_c0_seq1/g.32522  ORF comp22168_c0_seq1/g.32522 comp22168_c0_seq1/m.32522 type:complete len:726 (-) comp22168_c0_seq1:709-2886(-)
MASSPDPYADLRNTKTVDLLTGHPDEKREEIRTYFHKTFTIYEKLFEVIQDSKSYYYQPERLRHPLIFYYGHTATFYINKLVLAKVLSANERINPRLESICAVGVDEMSWDDLNTAHYDWPEVSEVKQYRDKVREVVDRVIRTVPLQMPIGWDSPLWIIMMGIEHERIHLETSSVLIRQMHLEDVMVHPLWKRCTQTGPAPENELVQVPGGQVTLGKPFKHALYGWDNEYGTHTNTVAPFKASKYLVSNGEYLKFVQGGGYMNQDYWSEEGWRWVSYKKAQAPVFWVARPDGGYDYRSMTEVMQMPWDWPVDVNYLEAKAFCEWMKKTTGKSIRLPTEDEYRHLRNLMTEQADQHEWAKAPGNINLEHFASSCPVNMFKQSDQPELYDIIGNVWQWTETPVHPFDGFKVHPIYDDFTTPTYDTKHNIIKGGAWVSTGNEATRDSRYAFRMHFCQHAGLRYVESEVEPAMPENAEPFEMDKQICEAIHTQFGKPLSSQAHTIPAFHKEVAHICLERKPQAEGGRQTRALEVGCLGGAGSFELANGFDEVVGIDLTARLIQVGHYLQEGRRFRYTMPDEGELVTYHEIAVQDLGLDASLLKKVTLMQGDTCNLPARLTGFDLILVSNLTRLYDPSVFLAGVHERLNEGGMLVILSAYDWDSSVTPVDKWVGGKKLDGESLSVFEGLRLILEKNFVNTEPTFEVTSFVQETRRRGRIFDMECSVWQKM